MAKKRKAPARAAEGPTEPSYDASDSRKRIRTYEDVADSEDEFHDARDEVILDEAPEQKRRRKVQEEEEFLQQSDEEVLGDSESEDDDRHAARGGDDEDELEGWGTTRADLYGADAIETEEQALEEEAEALRLQKKQLQAMTAADYGFDETEWQEQVAEKGNEDEQGRITEVLPQLQVADDMGPAERLKLLKSRYPEFEPLSSEMLKLQDIYTELRNEVESEESGLNIATKFRALSAYLGSLTMYFSLLTSPAFKGEAGATALAANKLRDHPVMESLMECRELWTKVKDLPADELSEEKESEEEWESEDEEADLQESLQLATKHSREVSGKPKSRAQRHAEAAQEAAEARKAERMKRTEADLANLDALLAPSALKKSSKAKAKSIKVANGADSDVGEETPLTAAEAEEKAKRKKSLRFYTSQIAQKANKRGESGRNAGGDEDIPHRERLRDRQARLNAEAEQRGRLPKGAPGADLDDASDDADHEQAHTTRNTANEDDEYYDMIAARTAQKKDHKAALAAAQKEAALQGGRVVVEEATVGPDGKRAISYQIEKNKGLTPHRKKDVRNPRVKKKKKYEEKKKKLASIKPIYKGGEGRGGYGGELTGIKKGLVKSVKL
ncbi:Hypothetical protein R9X50_00202400 [Acrodontium crateriforme]|uniref:Sas10 C-terminal domain-containing protein n=1 Tax=Acrodontium crateriforme TaxID=150365 RepID=A0AAQ3M0G8_9PEZI|nr:Hypothetical protein R9X50_00202400 [Acrodontium crateriforme]